MHGAGCAIEVIISWWWHIWHMTNIPWWHISQMKRWYAHLTSTSQHAMLVFLRRDGEDLDSQGEGSSQPDTISLASRTSQNTLDSDKVHTHTCTYTTYVHAQGPCRPLKGLKFSFWYSRPKNVEMWGDVLHFIWGVSQGSRLQQFVTFCHHFETIQLNFITRHTSATGEYFFNHCISWINHGCEILFPF